MVLISDTLSWQRLVECAAASDDLHLTDLFDSDIERGARMAVDLEDIYADFSRQRIDADTLNALINLAEEAGVPDFLRRMMAGEMVNGTEQRAALHTACRGTPTSDPDIHDQVSACDARMKSFVDAVHAGKIKTASGKPFQNVVSIGVGGSELGPLLALDALSDAGDEKMTVRICGNIDGIAFNRAFDGLDPAETLVLVTSKSFTTQETGLNARRARAMFEAALGDGWKGHFAAISANVPAAEEFGIDPERVFPMWDWVGGRYSVWSAVGMPVALAYGWDAFMDLRAGARDIDTHVLNAPISENLPILMALFTVWNTDFLDIRAEACVPYDTRLQLLPNYLQQLEMESNGKRVTRDGTPVAYRTQPAVFGGIGTNVQHAFFQQLHQGTIPAAVDIMVMARAVGSDRDMHDALTANAMAQADALAFGRTNTDDGHKHYPGNLPSTVLMYRDMNARTLGKLLAIYEHKTVAAACIWGINPFDQWGVELGKQLSADLEPVLKEEQETPARLQAFIDARKRLSGDPR